MNYSLIHSIWTVLVFISFIGIVFWAWSGKRKSKFDEAAHIPFEDDPMEAATLSVKGEEAAKGEEEEKHHG